jgi:hypothetical protein
VWCGKPANGSAKLNDKVSRAQRGPVLIESTGEIYNLAAIGMNWLKFFNPALLLTKRKFSANTRIQCKFINRSLFLERILGKTRQTQAILFTNGT